MTSLSVHDCMHKVRAHSTDIDLVKSSSTQWIWQWQSLTNLLTFINSKHRLAGWQVGFECQLWVGVECIERETAALETIGHVQFCLEKVHRVLKITPPPSSAELCLHRVCLSPNWAHLSITTTTCVSSVLFTEWRRMNEELVSEKLKRIQNLCLRQIRYFFMLLRAKTEKLKKVVAGFLVDGFSAQIFHVKVT